MLTNLKKSCMALMVAGALCSTQAGAFSPAASFDEYTPTQNVVVIVPDLAVARSEVISITEPDGSVAFYKFSPFAIDDEVALADDLADVGYVSPYDVAMSDQITVFNPDGSNWAYTPIDLSTWNGPFEAAYMTDEDSPATIYVAEYVSTPSYLMLLE